MAKKLGYLYDMAAGGAAGHAVASARKMLLTSVQSLSPIMMKLSTFPEVMADTLVRQGYRENTLRLTIIELVHTIFDSDHILSRLDPDYDARMEREMKRDFGEDSELDDVVGGNFDYAELLESFRKAHQNDNFSKRIQEAKARADQLAASVFGPFITQHLGQADVTEDNCLPVMTEFITKAIRQQIIDTYGDGALQEPNHILWSRMDDCPQAIVSALISENEKMIIKMVQAQALILLKNHPQASGHNFQ